VPPQPELDPARLGYKEGEGESEIEQGIDPEESEENVVK